MPERLGIGWYPSAATGTQHQKAPHTSGIDCVPRLLRQRVRSKARWQRSHRRIERAIQRRELTMTRGSAVRSEDRATAGRAPAPEEMVWIPGGAFAMGSDRHYPEEAPAHRVRVDGFWIDRTPVTNREFRALRQGDRLRHGRRDRPRPQRLSGRAAAHAAGGLAGVQRRPARRWTSPTGRSGGSFKFGADWRRPMARAARSPASTIIRSCTSPTGRGGLCELGRQGAADRSGMGVRRARRAGGRRVRLGRRVRARRPPDGEHLAGRVPAREHRASTATSAPRR